MKRIRLFFVLIVALVYFVGQYLYNIDIVENYAYQDFEEIGFGLINFITLLFVSFFIPINISKPSDAFLIFYFLVILSCLIFTQPLVNYDFYIKIKYIIFIIFPLFFTIFVTKFNVKFIPLPFNINLKQFNNLILILLIISFAFLLNYALKYGGFSFDKLYERRLEGRTQSSRLTSYVIGFVSNVLLAYCSFNFGLKKEKKYLIVSILIVLLGFYTLGMKSPALTFLLFSYIGFSYFNKSNFSLKLIFGILILTILSILENLYNGVSLINLFTIRRILVVQAEITQFYFSFFSSFSSTLEVFIGGKIPEQYSDLTYYIGDKYLNSEVTNANTNTFIFFLTKFGILGYAICNIFVSFLLRYFDKYYFRTNGPYLILAAAVFSYLINEQSFTVTLATSGVGIFTILIILLYDGYREKAN